MNSPPNPRQPATPEAPALTSRQAMPQSDTSSAGLAKVDSLQALLNSLGAIAPTTEAIERPPRPLVSSTETTTPSVSGTLSPAKLGTSFDMIDKLESLFKEGVDLERAINESKKKVTDLAAHCGVLEDEVVEEAPAPEAPAIRSLFAPNYLAMWLDAIAQHCGGQAGIAIVNGRRKVCHTHYVGWDSAPFRVHSDLVNKASIVAANRDDYLRSRCDSLTTGLDSSDAEQPSEPGDEETKTQTELRPETSLCVSLNRLSRNVGHSLLVKAMDLPQAKGKAVLFLGGDAIEPSRFQQLQETTEIKALFAELDTWLLIRRFQWSVRLMEAIEWIIARPKTIAAFIGVLAILLVLPVPYYPSRKCVVEPEARQYIGSPVAGRIASCDVRPGDQVVKDQLLVRLDDEQIMRDLATAEAELERARKKLDSSMALRAQGEVGLAKMDILRAQTKLESLQSQQKRMEVRASAAGVVIQGDWQRSIGMPVTLGQNLFEIAELSSLTAEVHLSAEDLGNIRVGDKVAIRSDATGSSSFYGVISRIEPRASVTDEGVFFLADVVIDDPEQRLRPGMKATGQIVAGWRSIGWLLFARPLRWLSNQWVW